MDIGGWSLSLFRFVFLAVFFPFGDFVRISDYFLFIYCLFIHILNYILLFTCFFVFPAPCRLEQSYDRRHANPAIPDDVTNQVSRFRLSTYRGL